MVFKWKISFNTNEQVEPEVLVIIYMYLCVLVQYKQLCSIGRRNSLRKKINKKRFSTHFESSFFYSLITQKFPALYNNWCTYKHSFQRRDWRIRYQWKFPTWTIAPRVITSIATRTACPRISVTVGD